MRWKDLRRSSNVRDVRGAGGGRCAGCRSGAAAVGGGLGAIVVVVLVVHLRRTRGRAAAARRRRRRSADRRTRATADGQRRDQRVRRARARQHRGRVERPVRGSKVRSTKPPELLVFDGAVQSACGYASSASGPFYCPGDRSVYLDTAFFDELAQMGGAGDFAAAYVIGHEVGHHVQNVARHGGLRCARRSSAASEVDANRLQVAMELQADCFAGVWAYHANRTAQRARARRRRGGPRCCRSHR